MKDFIIEYIKLLSFSLLILLFIVSPILLGISMTVKFNNPIYAVVGILWGIFNSFYVVDHLWGK